VIPLIKMINSKFYEFLKFRVRPWMATELSRYESPPGFLVWSLEVVDNQIRDYEKQELET